MTKSKEVVSPELQAKRSRALNGRWLKGPTGCIYHWNELLARRSDLTEVSGEEAFPEWFMPESQKGRKSKLDEDLATTEVPEAPVQEGHPHLNKEATERAKADPRLKPKPGPKPKPK